MTEEPRCPVCEGAIDPHQERHARAGLDGQVCAITRADIRLWVGDRSGPIADILPPRRMDDELDELILLLLDHED